MGLLFSTRRALLWISGIKYLLRAWVGGTFAQAYAGGQVLDTSAEGVVDGQLTVVEKDGTLAVDANGKCAFTAQSTPVVGHQGVYSQAIARALGRGLITTLRVDDVTRLVWCAWNDSADVGSANGEYLAGYFDNGNDLFYVKTQLEASVALFTGADGVDYQIALILGGYDVNGVPWRAGQPAVSYLYGATWLIEGGAFTDYILLWRTATSNTATLYAIFSNYNAAGTLEKFRVPDVDLKAVLQPTALSTFTAPNGTSLDAITPEVGGVWTEQVGDWEIQGDKATVFAFGSRQSATVSSGIADCFLRVSCKKGGSGGVDLHRDDAVVMRLSDLDNYWYAGLNDAANLFHIIERNAGGEVVRASAGFANVLGTTYDIIVICDGQQTDAFVDGGNKISYALAAFNQTATQHGLRARSILTEFDNFHINARTSTTYDATLGAV